MGALAGIRVLDLSRILAGPWSSQILGDLGADVIKVERPSTGDDTRRWGPPFVSDQATGECGDAAYFLSANRNKRSITADITTAEGQKLVRELAAEADVLIENYKVGGLAAYGLDAESLRAVNPRLIYCSITGFGQTGPYASRAGYDLLIQAMSGLMSITGPKDSETASSPQKVGVALVDILSGLYATVGILAALSHRDRTGEGQIIDVALLDVSVACLANQALNYLVSGVSPARMGNAHPNLVPYQDFPTSDSALVLAVGNNEQFARAWRVFELPAEPRFATNASRIAAREEIVAAITEKTRQKPTAYWIDALEKVGVPCGPINSIEQVFEDPHVIARGMKKSLLHPVAGESPTVANPLRLSATPVTYRSAPPTLGESDHSIGWNTERACS